MSWSILFHILLSHLTGIVNDLQRSEDKDKNVESKRTNTHCLTHYCDNRCLPGIFSKNVLQLFNASGFILSLYTEAKTCNKRVDCMDGSDEVCSLTSEGVWELTDPNIKINDYGFDFGYRPPYPDAIR